MANKLRLAGMTLDVTGLGNEKLLCKVFPYYEYADGIKTNTIAGYKYYTVLPAHDFSVIAVKIPGEKQLTIGAQYVPVYFEGLELKLYYDSNHTLQVSAKATAIKVRK